MNAETRQSTAQARAADGPARPPLVVDLEGALLRTSASMEAIVDVLFRRPLVLLAALPPLLTLRPHEFQARVAGAAGPDVSLAPHRSEVLAYIAAERAAGRETHLISSAPQDLCERVAAGLGAFDSVQGGAARARHAEEAPVRFPGGFVYAGRSADAHLWRKANGFVLIGAAPSPDASVEASFADRARPARAWLKALRVHQWSKNLLVFAPLFLSGAFMHGEALARVATIFAALCAIASGSYIFNDIADLGADRRHRTKNQRPFASGALPLGQGLAAGAALIALGQGVAFAVSPAAGAALFTYLATTLAYSVRLKRIVIVDVAVLAWLYTLRLIAGAAVLAQPPAEWLMTFSMMFFFSMSIAKRHVEIARAAPGAAIAGRGYLAKDAPVTLAFGIGGSVAAVLILVLYLMDEAFPSGLYASPRVLWAAPVLLAIWTMRIWILANRGELHDDPVSFAVRDRISLALGALLIASFLAAVFA